MQHSNHSQIWTAHVLTLFPEMFPGPLGYSIAGKALLSGLWKLQISDIREFANNKHANIDDRPFGGGNGMVMMPDVLGNALDHVIDNHKPKAILYMSPRGRVISQKLVKEIYDLGNVAILCGRFEGIDERVIEEYNILEISLGDFILSGGELAALALIDACIRLIPGLIHNEEVNAEESFSIQDENLLEYPHYTRPRTWRNREVPQILLSGNHKEISKWRLTKSKEITKLRRPDLWQKYNGSL
jgi:tRNA (guanine37-N1)-methyltransferase